MKQNRTFSQLIQPNSTPQSQPIPGREADMTQNEAGGYSFKVDDWTLLQRFLILGSESGTYYATGQKQALEASQALIRLLKTDSRQVIDLIVDISDKGRAPSNRPAIFALALASSEKYVTDPSHRRYALDQLSKIARIPTDLFIFVNEVLNHRKNGRQLQRAIQDWYNAAPIDRLTYHVLKYGNREGRNHRDMLRMFRPTPPDQAHDALYRRLVGKDYSLEAITGKAARQISAFDVIRQDITPRMAAGAIRDGDLTWDMVPTELLTDPVVWDALTERIPYAALIRQLARLTSNGYLDPMGNSDRLLDIMQRITDPELVEKSRIHPIRLLSALITYESGRGQAGSLKWTPSSKIVDALSDAFYLSFANLQPTGKRILLGLDVSGSMAGTNVIGIPGLDCVKASAAMALILARSEPRHTMIAYDTRPYSVTLSPRQRLDDAMTSLARLGGGGTDCSVPIEWAIAYGIQVDAFIILTDSQTWAGRSHPVQGIERYRQQLGIPAKLITVAMAANSFSVGDTSDAGTMTVVGFDTNTPDLIRDFIAD
jgi:60 kDa SS-A/Ro ribonucleoprotein